MTPSPDTHIIVRGAKVHNLKNIDLAIPRNQLVVLTGLSGSGKSSLAFDTIYAEGQRRYIESLSAYARQFIGMLERPDVESIEGLSPSISIEQKSVSHNPRSTVGTVTEIYDFLRLLFARVGIQFCHNCGSEVKKQSVDQIVDAILQLPKGETALILAPVVRARKGHYRELFNDLRREGFVRVRVDGALLPLSEGMKVDRYKIHNIEVVVDRIVLSSSARRRVAESVEVALRYGNGVLAIQSSTGDQLFSRRNACEQCGISYDELAPNSFSFNTPMGQCPKCQGLGELKTFSEQLIVPNANLSVNEGALAPFGKPRHSWAFSQLNAVAERYKIDYNSPWKKVPQQSRRVLMYGAGDEQFEVSYRLSSGRTYRYRHRFDGIISILQHRYDETTSATQREWVESFMATTPCPACKGGRLRKESLAVNLVDARTGARYSIHDIVSLSLQEAAHVVHTIAFTPRGEQIARLIMREIKDRLGFLLDVGLGYLSLDRSARTLSGGEGQRIRLATQVGTKLVGVLYILDEPSIGLHQRDNRKLIDSLKALRDLGNTVIVVEHDREMMERSDYIIDLGPGAGEHGGRVVAEGRPSELAKLRRGKNGSVTAEYLAGKSEIIVPAGRRPGNGHLFTIRGAAGNNLKNIDVTIPLGTLTCVTGVSGSGKSTLFNETLYPALMRHFYTSNLVPLPYKDIVGLQHIDKVIDIDQSPIGRTPRSNPATYTGVFTMIRDLFAELPESKMRGYRPGRFSFNVAGGRCEECEGDGVKKIEMNFLPDVYVECSVCNGKRYNRQTLEVLYKGKSIADVLDMTVEEALELFFDLPAIRRKIGTLHDVGMGYIRLGQQATTLSGGEAQRVKLATELSKVGTGKTLYILDEPTTGLHFKDIDILMNVLHRLVDKGNTVVVIEHNLDVIKLADWIIDLGPEGGERGGTIVAEGTPESVAVVDGSYTGYYLRAMLPGFNGGVDTPRKNSSARRSPS